ESRGGERLDALRVIVDPRDPAVGDLHGVVHRAPNLDPCHLPDLRSVKREDSALLRPDQLQTVDPDLLIPASAEDHQHPARSPARKIWNYSCPHDPAVQK